MLEWWQGAALGAATVLTGLMAGLYFAFSVAVMPGLAAAGDRTFVTAMQGVNVRILNPLFGLAFAGAALTPAAALLLHLPGGGTRAAVPWVAAALVLYAASLVVTFTVNVPLNNALDAAGDAPRQEARAAFEARWVRWNHARTVLCVLALAALARALVLHGRG
jgi:uncharacterized membrane protein